MKKKKTEKLKLINNFIEFFKNENNKKVIGILFVLFAMYFFIAFTSFLFQWKEDFSVVADKKNEWYQILTNSEMRVNNALGKLGALFSHFFVYVYFGISAYLIPIIFLFSGIKLLGYHLISIKKYIRQSLWGLIWIPVFTSHFFSSNSSSGEKFQFFEILAGGNGIESTKFIVSLLGSVGTTLLIISTFLIFIILNFNVKLDKIFLFFKNIIPKKKKLNNNEEIKVNITTAEEINLDKKLRVKEAVLHEEKNQNEENLSSFESEDNLNIQIVKTDNEKEINQKEVQNKLKELGDYDPTLDLSSYKFPVFNLLNDYGSGEINIDKNELEENKQKIVDTLANYKIGIASISATIGPTITLYEIVPEAGVKISKIKNLEDDIALSLSAVGIRIIAPIPGKGTIGIEVPNAKATTVSMSTVLKSEKFQNSDMDLPIAFGKTISNETYIVDLAKMPHLLMAGATGQGKSVGLNAILASLLYKKHPSQVKFVLVDPKKVELTLFNKIERHFLAKLPDTEEAIITDTKKVVNTVNSLCIEMDQRYELLKNAMCRNLKEYNNKFISRKLNPEEGHRFLPYIVLVIDEFADLIMTAGKEIETPIARLAQLARAIGIHLIIATQRPSVNVITGLIKANFPARVAFKVTSSTDSRTILDSKGAEQLIGKGDMLISTGPDLVRLQCAFIDTPEVEKICDFIGSQRAYPNAFLLPEYVGDSEGTGNDADLENRDALFDDAARLVVNQQTGSTSNIQRRMKIGYNRAGRIIDELEAAGIVGPFEGSKARQVIIKNELELDELLNKLNNNE